MRRSKQAISAVLGTAIALVIVFTVFIPLIMYIQSLQTIFMQEANRRLQYELERLHEKLEVHVSISPPRGGELNYRVYVWVYNPGILTVSIPTIYIESRNKGIIPIDISKEEKYNLSMVTPGERKVGMIKGFYFSPGDESDVIRVKVVTTRGNGFISKEVIGPRSLPYNLIIIVSDMTFGRRYSVDVTTLSKSEELSYGCVLLPDQRHARCSEGQSAIIEPQSFNDTKELVIFKVAPGNYRISLRDITEDESAKEPIVDRDIEVYDDVILYIPIPEMKWPETAPLNVSAIHKNIMLVADEGESSIVIIPYLISLGAIAEPLRDVKVEIDFIEGSCSVNPPGSESQSISRIYPGQTYFANFTAVCQPGGTVKYRLSIIEAYGVLSGKRYEKFERASDQGMIKVCVVERKMVHVKGEAFEEISYVSCP